MNIRNRKDINMEGVFVIFFKLMKGIYFHSYFNAFAALNSLKEEISLIKSGSEWKSLSICEHS